MAATTVLRAQMGTNSYCRVWHRRAHRTWASHPTRTLPSSSASRACPRLIVSSRHELPEKVSTRLAMLPCQPTTTASLRVLLQHCWQDPGCGPCKCSIVGAGRGQELLFNCSKCIHLEMPLEGCCDAALGLQPDLIYGGEAITAIRDVRESRDVLVLFFIFIKK
ncbi:uncharacterized protein LOC110432043 isoform X2 [Sorghum bicolor]|uniref:uncharacterized protein LOC110432043 isoform X2 n=1 Tax=Sorghum bicolor TaxID=4558 RepID=UPI00076BBF52|nr:uncharacterized protein LOC110432043 isoform X2 [Sorghum bicolor]|eukprot:XP_021307685.1 uncharacterized protein LOC110432043 isoform X2 [Sorghum bicolor]